MISKLLQFLTLLFVLSLSIGCSAYPNLKADASLKAPDYTKEWKCYGEDFSTSDDDGKLQKARGCALATLDDFNRLLGNAARDDRTMSYTLWGLGTWAGLRAIDAESSDTVLKNITVAVAGLLGLRQVSGTAEHRKILNQGITAIQCVIDAANAVEQANRQLTAVNATQTLKSATASANPVAIMNMVNINENADPSVVVAFGTFGHLIGSQVQSVSSLQSSITSALPSIGLQLGGAVQRIRQAVRTELANSAPDPTAVFDTQRQLVDSMVKQIANDGEQAEQAVALLDAMGRSGLSNAPIANLKAIAAASAQPKNVREQCVYGPQSGS